MCILDKIEKRLLSIDEGTAAESFVRSGFELVEVGDAVVFEFFGGFEDGPAVGEGFVGQWLGCWDEPVRGARGAHVEEDEALY